MTTMTITLLSEAECTVASLVGILIEKLPQMATSTDMDLRAFRALFTAVLSGGSTCNVPGHLNAHLDFKIKNNRGMLGANTDTYGFVFRKAEKEHATKADAHAALSAKLRCFELSFDFNFTAINMTIAEIETNLHQAQITYFGTHTDNNKNKIGAGYWGENAPDGGDTIINTKMSVFFHHQGQFPLFLAPTAWPL